MFAKSTPWRRMPEIEGWIGAACAGWRDVLPHQSARADALVFLWLRYGARDAPDKIADKKQSQLASPRKTGQRPPTPQHGELHQVYFGFKCAKSSKFA
jgi:hypothetical protein